MNLKNVIATILSKSIILILNFMVVVLSTNLWGTEGRGIISIVVADIAIIAIFNNILAGNSVAYFSSRAGLSKLLLPAYLWILAASMAGVLVFSLFHHPCNPFVLLAIALVNSMLSLNLYAFVGYENIKLYNLMNLLTPAFLILFILFFEFVLKLHSINSYLFGFIGSQAMVLIISSLKLKTHLQNIQFSFTTIRDTFRYGWKNELSYLLLFLNYRLSYFLILYFQGINSVGLYSVGIVIAESIWLLSKSITLVQYSKILNLTSDKLATNLTKTAAKLSFYSSVVFVGILMLIPASLYGHIFGRDFSGVKQILVCLLPGIIAIAVSNVYDHYFSAINQLGVLIVRSLLGFIATITLSLILIPLWGIVGASLVASFSYMVSSIYLMVMFYKGKKMKRSDFVLTRRDFLEDVLEH